ncbi:MAG: lipopolysaccharide heptosyltransferase II [Burkholderiales bacterium]
MAQPLLASLRVRLRDQAPGSRIEVLAPPWVAPVLRRMAEVDEVIEAVLRHGELQLGERWSLGRALKARGYAEAIVLPNTVKSVLVPFFAGVPVRTGYGRSLLLNCAHRVREEATSLQYARLAQAPGTEPALPLPFPSLLSSNEKIAATTARFGIHGRYIALCPGAEYGPAKRWPYFRELASALNSPVVLLGGPGDLEGNRGLPGTNLIGKTTLDEAIDLIAGAQAVVSNDSGLMHVAAATGRPLVALFGSSSPERTPPLSAHARVVWLKPECSPCFARICPLGHFKCMRELPAERVLHELQALA